MPPDRTPTLVSANGVDLNVRRGGEGPRLLFLPGTGMDLASTGLVLAPYEARFDTVSLDQRGVGQTVAPPGPWTMADYAADALALLDHLGWATCAVAGLSFGGMVAQELAVTAPERVERLALLCTSAGGAGGSSYPLQDLVELAPDERVARYTTLIDTRFTAEFLAADRRSRTVAQVLASRQIEERSPARRRGEAEQLHTRAGHDVWDRLPAISCPTLVACGRTDGIAPLANSQAIARQIPGAELRVYEGGHAFFAQDRSATGEIVEFLAGGS